MSIEDLKEQNILLPEEEWGEHNLETTMSQIPVLLLFICSVTGCAVAFWGDGHLWTWIGVIVYFLSFFGIIILSDRAIRQQGKRTKHEKTEFRKNDGNKNSSEETS